MSSLELPDAEPGVTCSRCTCANPVTATLCISCDAPLGQVPLLRAPLFVYLPGPKAHVTPPDGTGQRLYDAANAGRVEEVRALCKEWAGNIKVVNFKYGEQYTPLYTASQNDHHEVVDVLLSTAGVDANMAIHVTSLLYVELHIMATLSVSSIFWQRGPVGLRWTLTTEIVTVGHRSRLLRRF